MLSSSGPGPFQVQLQSFFNIFEIWATNFKLNFLSSQMAKMQNCQCLSDAEFFWIFKNGLTFYHSPLLIGVMVKIKQWLHFFGAFCRCFSLCLHTVKNSESSGGKRMRCFSSTHNLQCWTEEDAIGWYEDISCLCPGVASRVRQCTVQCKVFGSIPINTSRINPVCHYPNILSLQTQAPKTTPPSRPDINSNINDVIELNYQNEANISNVVKKPFE